MAGPSGNRISIDSVPYRQDGYDPVNFYNTKLDPSRDLYWGTIPRPDDPTPRCIVYLVTNIKVMDGCYIGMTEKGLPKRKHQHLWTARTGRGGVFHRAIRKYGEDSFRWRVIEVWPDYFSALDAERKCIRILKPAYNLTAGGGGIKGYKHTPETKIKMSAAKKGKPGIWARQSMPDHLRKRLADARRSERGKIIPPEIIDKYRHNASLANKARRTRVVHLQSGETFESVTAAAKKFGFTTGGICYLCSHKCKGRRGHSFRYVDK
jgi:group I intron endonuclease